MKERREGDRYVETHVLSTCEGESEARLVCLGGHNRAARRRTFSVRLFDGLNTIFRWKQSQLISESSGTSNLM